MDRDSSFLQSRIEQLETTIRGLESRVASLEQDRGAETSAEAAESESEARHELADPTRKMARQAALPLVGQTLLILGGAFLLRWLTETGVLPPAGGTAVGLAYAGVWIALAGWAASRGNRVSPGFRGLASALIGFPLVWEATVKFGFLPALLAAGVLTVMIGCCLFVAWKWSIRSLAWTLVLAAVPTTIGLAFATKLFVPYLGLLLLVGLASVWLGYLRGWTALGWITALVINSVLVLVTLFRMSDPVPPIVDTLRSGSLVLLLLGLIAVYFGSFVTRTLVRGRDATVLEIGQSVTVTVIGFAGSFLLVRGDYALQNLIGWAGLLLAIGCYAAAFAFIDRRRGRGRNFIFYSSLGIAFLLMACRVLLSGSAATVALALVAAFAAWVGGRWRRATLSLHGAIYLIAASLFGGVFSVALDAFLGPTVPPIGSISPPYLLVLVVAAFCASLSVSMEGSPWGQSARGTRVADLAVLLAATGGAAILAFSQVLPADGAGVINRGDLATLRAAVLAASAVLVAGASRWPRFSEASWFVYPLLLACGLKILMEDFRTGQSFTLFASLTCFGLALIIAPRLTRRPDLQAAE